MDRQRAYNERHHRNPLRPNPPKTATEGTGASTERAALSGMRARRRLKDVPEVKRRELVERSLDLGLEAARSVKDRNISLFSRGSTRCSPVSRRS